MIREGYIYGPYKLTDGQVSEIIWRYKVGERGATLAKEFNVSTKTVLKYIKENGRPHKNVVSKTKNPVIWAKKIK